LARIFSSYRKRDAGPARPPSFDGKTMYAAVVLGAILFSAGFYLSRNRDGQTLPLIAYLFTPLFIVPLIAVLAKHRQIGFWGALVFLLGTSVAHFAAIILADVIYGYRPCLLEDQAQQAVCVASQALAQLALRAVYGGWWGGIAGAGASFLAMLLLRRMRSRKRSTIMIGATIVLGLLGAIGLSLGPPEERSAISYIFGLFLPWQLVFGAAIVLLFDDDTIRRLSERFRRRPSPSP
jgi:hypothetical protein